MKLRTGGVVVVGLAIVGLTLSLINHSKHDLVPDSKAPSVSSTGGARPQLKSPQGVSPPAPESVLSASTVTEVLTSPTRRVRLTDVATYSPIGQIALVAVAHESRPIVEHITDEQGVASIPADELRSLAISTPGWSLVRTLDADFEADTIELYAYRNLTVHVECLIDTDADLVAGTPMTIVVRRPISATIADIDRGEVGGPSWVKDRGLRSHRHVASLPASKIIAIETQLLPDQGVSVSAPGLWSDIVAISDVWPVETVSPIAHVRVLLKPGYRVAGTLADESGRPLANRTVTLLVVRRMPIDEAIAARAKPEGAGLTMQWAKGSDFAVVQTRTTAQTRDDGSFEVQSAVDGEALIYTTQPGFHITHERFPLLSSSRPVELRAEATRGLQEFRITWQGRPLPEGTLLAATLGDDIQYAHLLDVGPRGMVSGEWLERGQRYFFRYWPSKSQDLVRGTGAGEIIWSTPTVVEMEGLTRARIDLMEARQRKVGEDGSSRLRVAEPPARPR